MARDVRADCNSIESGDVDAVADRVAALIERGYNWPVDPTAICPSSRVARANLAVVKSALVRTPVIARSTATKQPSDRARLMALDRFPPGPKNPGVAMTTAVRPKCNLL